MLSTIVLLLRVERYQSGVIFSCMENQIWVRAPVFLRICSHADFAATRSGRTVSLRANTVMACSILLTLMISTSTNRSRGSTAFVIRVTDRVGVVIVCDQLEASQTPRPTISWLY